MYDMLSHRAPWMKFLVQTYHVQFDLGADNSYLDQWVEGADIVPPSPLIAHIPNYSTYPMFVYTIHDPCTLKHLFCATVHLVVHVEPYVRHHVGTLEACVRTGAWTCDSIQQWKDWEAQCRNHTLSDRTRAMVRETPILLQLLPFQEDGVGWMMEREMSDRGMNPFQHLCPWSHPLPQPLYVSFVNLPRS